MKYFCFILISLNLLISQSRNEIFRIDDLVVFEDEFKNRFETTIGFHSQSKKINENKYDYLFSLIAEKLFELEAKKKYSDLKFDSLLKPIEEMIVRDELYKIELLNNVTLDSNEIKTGLINSFTKNKVVVAFSENKIKENIDYYIYDTLICEWGKYSEDFENIIFNLKLNVWSSEIKKDDGYYYFKIIGKEKVYTLNEDLKKDTEGKVVEILQNREASKHIPVFLNKIIKNKSSEINKSYYLQLKSVFEYKLINKKTLNYDEFEYFKTNLNNIWDSNFIKINTKIWTIENVVSKILELNINFNQLNKTEIGKNLQFIIQDLIDQEFITQYAYEKNLQLNPSVKSEIEKWSNYYLSETFYSKLKDKNINEEIAKIAEKHTILINSENLKKLQLSNIPMIAFQRYAFGGKNFANPFLRKNTEWVKYYKGKKLINQ